MVRAVVTVLLLVLAAKLNPSQPGTKAPSSVAPPAPELDPQEHEPWRQLRRIAGDGILPALLFAMFRVYREVRADESECDARAGDRLRSDIAGTIASLRDASPTPWG